MEIPRYTQKELFDLVYSEAKASGELDDLLKIMDYQAGASSFEKDVPLSSMDFDFKFSANYGGSEGIYLDGTIVGKYKEGSEPFNAPLNFCTIKTLRTDLEAMKTISAACGILNHFSTKFVNEHSYNFLPEKQLREWGKLDKVPPKIQSNAERKEIVKKIDSKTGDVKMMKQKESTKKDEFPAIAKLVSKVIESQTAPYICRLNADFEGPSAWRLKDALIRASSGGQTFAENGRTYIKITDPVCQRLEKGGYVNQLITESGLDLVPDGTSFRKLLDAGYKWSGNYTPEIGQPVGINFNELGTGKIGRFFLENGYIGIVVHLDKPPKWWMQQNGKRFMDDGKFYSTVFGAETKALEQSVRKEKPQVPGLGM